MDKKPTKENKFSRRSMLPILGSTLLIPFLGIGKTIEKESTDTKEDEFQTLLKPDGTVVKVRTSTIKNSKVVQKNISNKGLLHWLGKKL
ncbi:hypothetical protein [Namhaeicola litoreus]|uniref:Uncharacterized protein n=1 Tax=Namhaeicola litoreus TaxID=1052145 RepID=A0ABW3XZH2_9FLAO